MSQINIGGLTIDKFYLGNSDSVQIYLGNVKLYPQSTPPTPVSSCYEVIPQPITSYTSTTYDSVYSLSDAKWYMKNNLSQYEEYGVYDIVENISSATTYNGKLAVVVITEYQYSGGSWSVVGTYEDASVTYTIDDTNPSQYEGQELATTFKIPTADIEALGGSLNLRIRTADGGELNIRNNVYRYMGSSSKTGTVTNDNDYYYYELPDIDSVVIKQIQYRNSKPIHLIVGSKQATVEYAEKETPTAKVYNTVADIEAASCPTVGVGQYGVVGDNVYKFEESEEWVNKDKSGFKFVAKYNDGNANVIECNTSNELSTGGTQPSYLSKNAMTDAYIGDCVTSIGDGAFNGCSGLTSIYIPDGVTSIGNHAFNVCSSLTSIYIPDGVTSIGMGAFNGTTWFNTYSADTSHRYGNIIYINDVAYIATSTSITYCAFREGTVSIGGGCCYNCSKLISITIPDSVTSIGSNAFTYCNSLTSVTIGNVVANIGQYAFNNCRSLSNITVNAVTPPSLGRNALSFTNDCPIYVPAQSVDAYKAASIWSTYAARIQAIPT